MTDNKSADNLINRTTVRDIHDPDEINLLEYIYALVKNKWWIIGATIIGVVAGYLLAKHKGPNFISEIVISAKVSENSKTPNFSGFGAFGGIVASQLSISASPGLDNIELILKSRKFNAELIEKYNLLPMIYKEAFPDAFLKMYDTLKKEWKKEFNQPEMLGIGSLLKGAYLKVAINNNNTMTIKVESKNTVFSDTILCKCIEYLNCYIKQNVKADADDNVVYLEKQLQTIIDPLLREKIQGMIANELEKSMLVSKEAFKIIDPPYRYSMHKEKKLYPMVFGAGLFFIALIFIVFKYVFVNGSQNNEVREMLKKIKKSLLNISGNS